MSLGDCMCSLRVRVWVVDLMLSDVCEASCVYLCVCARACVYVCVCVCVCVFDLDITKFQPQSKEELQGAVQKC